MKKGRVLLTSFLQSELNNTAKIFYILRDKRWTIHSLSRKWPNTVQQTNRILIHHHKKLTGEKARKDIPPTKQKVLATVPLIRARHRFTEIDSLK